MQHTTTVARRPSADIVSALTTAAVRSARWLQRAWHELMLDEDERFLRGASDLGDLERRLRALQRGPGERFAPLDRSARQSRFT